MEQNIPINHLRREKQMVWNGKQGRPLVSTSFLDTDISCLNSCNCHPASPSESHGFGKGPHERSSEATRWPQHHSPLRKEITSTPPSSPIGNSLPPPHDFGDPVPHNPHTSPTVGSISCPAEDPSSRVHEWPGPCGISVPHVLTECLPDHQRKS